MREYKKSRGWKGIVVVTELKNGRNVLRSSKHKNESRFPFSSRLSRRRTYWPPAGHRAFFHHPRAYREILSNVKNEAKCDVE